MLTSHVLEPFHPPLDGGTCTPQSLGVPPDFPRLRLLCPTLHTHLLDYRESVDTSTRLDEGILA
jgi:hypothetical protein